MKPALVVWSLIMLVGFWASHVWANVYGESVLWIAWAVVFLVGYFAIGKTMKKMPKEIGMMWAMVTVFGFLATLAVAQNLVSVNFSYLMGLWLLLTGAALYTGSHKGGSPSDMALSIVYLVSAVLIPLEFANVYFLGGALTFGLLGLIHSLLMK